ncbi:MAG: Rab family GTPase [Candidatus Odinarchaeia archaeon]
MSDLKLFKVIVAGEGGVGKTTLINRFITGEFTHSKTTIGVAFYIAEVKLNSAFLKLQIWDLGGEERFRTILPSFCRGARGAFIIFDLSRYSTFLRINEWIELIKKSTGEVPIFLIGAKADLIDENEFDESQIEDIVKKYNLDKYYATSAVTGLNVEQVFKDMANRIYEKVTGTQ